MGLYLDILIILGCVGGIVYTIKSVYDIQFKEGRKYKKLQKEVDPLRNEIVAGELHKIESPDCDHNTLYLKHNFDAKTLLSRKYERRWRCPYCNWESRPFVIDNDNLEKYEQDKSLYYKGGSGIFRRQEKILHKIMMNRLKEIANAGEKYQNYKKDNK